MKPLVVSLLDKMPLLIHLVISAILLFYIFLATSWSYYFTEGNYLLINLALIAPPALTFLAQLSIRAIASVSWLLLFLSYPLFLIILRGGEGFVGLTLVSTLLACLIGVSSFLFLRLRAVSTQRG